MGMAIVSHKAIVCSTLKWRYPQSAHGILVRPHGPRLLQFAHYGVREEWEAQRVQDCFSLHTTEQGGVGETQSQKLLQLAHYGARGSRGDPESQKLPQLAHYGIIAVREAQRIQDCFNLHIWE